MFVEVTCHHCHTVPHCDTIFCIIFFQHTPFFIDFTRKTIWSQTCHTSSHKHKMTSHHLHPVSICQTHINLVGWGRWSIVTCAWSILVKIYFPTIDWAFLHVSRLPKSSITLLFTQLTQKSLKLTSASMVASSSMMRQKSFGTWLSVMSAQVILGLLMTQQILMRWRNIDLKWCLSVLSSLALTNLS